MTDHRDIHQLRAALDEVSPAAPHLSHLVRAALREAAAEPPQSFTRRFVLPAAGGVALVVVLIVTLTVSLAIRANHSGATVPGAAGQPAGGARAASGQTIDGIQCQTQEQVLLHIHAHLAIYVNGQPRPVPMGIGIPHAQNQATPPDGPFVVAGSGSCFYWLHSHMADGVIHIESPVQRTYTLGDWFDIWGQPLSGSQVGPDTGTVTAYLNGRRYTGDPRLIPLQAHGVVQLDVGTDVPPQPYTFADGL